MNVVECDVPPGSMLSREVIEHAYFRDSYRAPLSRRELDIVDVFFGIFAHHPLWMKLLLIVRNKVASLAGLDAPTTSEVLNVEIKDRYVVGEKIGVWPIFSLSEDEVVAGRNNKHMDFRLSVLKVPDGDRTSVVVSTICTVHSLSGKLYLFFVVPFHRYGVQKLMANAIAAGRL
ncbi:DUF2867 domain-containing protein [Bradyrhizobium cenepequi]|uniref:DUF2867 domain-containing protein n=1 Tax=Bradyrhizobium cenepequi TaxID=2821403 RepID=UPI001CE2CE45|nr:DUF2867 domain-containing protein [Bradyrhizobium cenepequi]MCA6113148.1 DUF2867 domain-containing protein [Bradyrhizobium cenepequi]